MIPDIVTRNFINKNIQFYDFKNTNSYIFYDLSREIDFFKNILAKNSTTSVLNKSIVIGIQPSIKQTACIFACFELGIKICIIDYDRPDSFRQYDYVDPKTELLLPIDFFIVLNYSCTDKFNYFSKICSKTIVVDSILDHDYSVNEEINATNETSIMICTSSGTTDTPKVIEHSHQFIANLAKRNAKFYDQSVAITHNLNHGSSFATFFLPALHSINVTSIRNSLQDFSNLDNLEFLADVNHIMIPYTYQIDQFIKTNCSANKIIYTLSSISSGYLKSIYSKKFKDIISFFGSNETSGPTLINQISSVSFSPKNYSKLDDFYDITLVNNELNVTLPFYTNRTINTKDKFISSNNIDFTFLGRDDLKRINGRIVPETLYIEIAKKEGIDNFLIIYDKQENQIYLVVRKHHDNLEEKVHSVAKKLQGLSSNAHTINKFALLDLTEFMTGVKVDHELLRHYFRQKD